MAKIQGLVYSRRLRGGDGEWAVGEENGHLAGASGAVDVSPNVIVGVSGVFVGFVTALMKPWRQWRRRLWRLYAVAETCH